VLVLLDDDLVTWSKTPSRTSECWESFLGAYYVSITDAVTLSNNSAT